MANTVAALLRSTSSILVQNFLCPTKYTIFQPRVIRHLYASTTLGIDSYVLQRERTLNQLSNISDKFREKMKEYTTDDSKNMVFTEDLKNMVHLAKTDEDIGLVVKMMKRFNQQNQQLRFGNFVFGPVVMRLFHFMNKPEEALQCFKAPELQGFFDQIMSYQLLLDLLYENKRFNDILETFEIIIEKQTQAMKYPKNVVVLVMAACYKLNTPESLKYALQLWSSLAEVGHQPMRRACTFCAGLALNQGKPDAAIEILSTARNANYTTIRNIKIAALAEVGRMEDIIPILKSILQEDTPHVGGIHTFNRDVLERVTTAVEKQNNPDLKSEYNRIVKYLAEQGHVSELTLDQQLCLEISSPPIVGKKGTNQQQFNKYQRNFDPNNRNQNRAPDRMQRPGLSDLH